jgi:hypothetical protein
MLPAPPWRRLLWKLCRRTSGRARYNTSMKSRISRRQIAIGLGAAPLLAQAPAKPSDPNSMEAARETVKRNSDALSKFTIPQATEPSFIFRA